MKGWSAEISQFTRRFEALEQARKKWDESEWVLRKLRSRSSKETNQPDDDKLIEWHHQLTSAPYQQ
jgi:protein subunit release factor B